MLKLKKVKNGECYDCDVRLLVKTSELQIASKLSNLCDSCRNENIIYKQVKNDTI